MDKKFNTLIDFFVYGLLFGSLWLNFTLLPKQTIDNAVRWKVIQLEEKRDSTASMALETVYQDSINVLLHEWVHYDK